MSQHQSSQQKRSLKQFSIRTLLLLTLLVAVALGLAIPKWKEQQFAETLRQKGWQVKYANQTPYDSNRTTYQQLAADYPDWLDSVDDVRCEAVALRTPLASPLAALKNGGFVRSLPAPMMRPLLVQKTIDGLPIFSKLKTLHITEYRNPDDEWIRRATIDWTPIGNIQTLAHLKLANLQLRKEDLAAIAKLKNLENLNLEYTAVTDERLVFLGELTNLKILNLSENKITGKGLIHLQALVNLEELHLSENQIQGDALKVLIKLPNLKRLYLAHCDLKDEQLEFVAKMPSLEYLSLHRNQVEGNCLAYMSQLRILDLSFNTLTQQGMSAVPSSPLWEEIYLDYFLCKNFQEVKGLENFTRAQNLRIFRMEYAMAEKQSVLEFAKLKHLEELKIGASYHSAELIQLFQERLPNCKIK